jgi:hypothetical protein
VATTSVLYLDVDDEITSAAGRIRSAEARRVAIVLPYGSRVATSRINFRLLARDALTHEKRLSIVAGDAATRALAASAGLPVFANVGEYEDSEEGSGPTSDAPTPRITTAAVGGTALAGAATAGAALAGDAGAAAVASAEAAGIGAAGAGAADAGVPPAAPARRPGRSPEVDTSAVTVEGRTPLGPAALAAAATPSVGSAPRVRPERVRPRAPTIARTPILVGLGVVALVAVIGVVAAYLLLPSATIAITPREETIGPTSFQIVADPEATAPDVAAGVVPATVVELPLDMTDTFSSTGKRVEEAPATGRVRFENLDFTSTNSIAKGAVVSTESGVRFRLDKGVTVPRAQLVGLTVVPATASVDVTAVDAGPEGNVAQNSIRSVPRGENPLFLNVTNPDPTEGGEREEFPRITQEDIDKATAALKTGLQDSFTDELADPALGGGGATVFPDTAELGDPVWSVDPQTLVGQEVAEFELGASATGTVTAVDQTPIETIAESRLAESVESGYELLPDSSDIQVSPGSVQGGAIRFPVTVTARQIRVLDPAALEAEVRGLPLDDARAILETYGTVDVQVWPDWVGAIPTIDGRVDVTVEGDLVETPDPSESPP